MSEESIPLNLFCCYADEDEEFRNSLDTHLNALKRNKPMYNLKTEYSRKILAGMEREREETRHLNNADIILLLISPEFLGSGDYYDKEITPAMERHKADSPGMSVIPILLRHCMVDRTIFSDLDMLPAKNSFITDTDKSRWDKVFADIAKGIEKAANQLVVSPSFLQKKKKEKFEAFFHEGRDLREKQPYDGALERALEKFEKALQADPQHANAADAYYYKGDLLNNLGEFERALEALDASISLRPGNAYIYNAKGFALNALKRYNEALIEYDQAIRLDPGYATAYANKGKALFQLTRYDEALIEYDQAIRLDPNCADAYYHKGKIFYLRNQQQEAIIAFKEAERLNPNYLPYAKDHALAHKSQGDLFSQNAHYDEALAEYEQALRLTPDDMTLYCDKGRTLFALKRYEEALVAYDKAIHLDPDYAPAYQQKGDTLRALSSSLEFQAQEAYALAHLLEAQQAIAHDANDADAYYKKARALRTLTRESEAEEAYNYARQIERLQKVQEDLLLHPDEPTVHYRKGVVLFQLERNAEALEAFEEAIRRDPSNYQVYYEKGDLLRVLDRQQEANESYAKGRLVKANGVLLLDPKNAFAYHTKGEALTALNRTQEAQEAYTLAGKLGLYS